MWSRQLNEQVVISMSHRLNNLNLDYKDKRDGAVLLTY